LSLRSASPIKHVTYSNDGTFFATASQVIEHEIFSSNKFCLIFFFQNDRLVKIWYRTIDNSAIISFISTYLPHPRAVTYISWRQTSHFFTE
jgi:hypothetical protein